MESENAHLHRKGAEESIKAIYSQYREAICRFGNRVTAKPVDRYIGFWSGNHRFATIHVHADHLKIWLKIAPGAINDPERRARATEIAHTVWGVRPDDDFEYILGLIRQAFDQPDVSTVSHPDTSRATPLNATYSAVVRRDSKWWIGWVEEVPGVNSQGKTRQELLQNLKSALKEALEMNRAEARQAAGKSFEETSISI